MGPVTQSGSPKSSGITGIHHQSPTGVNSDLNIWDQPRTAGPATQSLQGGTFGLLIDSPHSMWEVRTVFAAKSLMVVNNWSALKADSGGFHVRVHTVCTHMCEFNSIVGGSGRHLRICAKTGDTLLKSIPWSSTLKNRGSGILAVLLDPLAVGTPKFVGINLASSKFQVNLCFLVLAGLRPDSSDDQFLEAGYSVTRTIHAALGTIRISFGW